MDPTDRRYLGALCTALGLPDELARRAEVRRVSSVSGQLDLTVEVEVPTIDRLNSLRDLIATHETEISLQQSCFAGISSAKPSEIQLYNFSLTTTILGVDILP